MKLSAILLARVLGFIDINELNPHGTIYLPALVPALIDRFQFKHVPKAVDDFDENKGIAFRYGYINGHVVDEFTVYADGIKVDTRSSTDNSKAVMKETLQWLADDHGLAYHDGTIKRWGYVSTLSFESDFDLDIVSPAVRALKERVAAELADDPRIIGPFCVEAVTIGVEKLFDNKASAEFSVARRVKASLDEGKYFSTAPMPTDVHLSVLRQFEEDLIKQKGWYEG